jgi:DNA-binding FadR family transcriptional regulator
MERKSLADSDPIPRRKLSRDVLDRLLSRISAGDFPPGTFMPSEREIMETFQVGRPAVREALQEIQRMGLITIAHGERARVIAPTARSMLDQIAGTARHLLATSPRTLDQLKEARQFFEVGVVRVAAARATHQDVRELGRLIEAQQSTLNDFSGFLRADIAFHRRIAAIIDNPIFAAVSEAMLEWLSNYHVGLVRKVGREQPTMAEHRLILDRIKAHDVEGAAAAMTTHLTRSQDLYARSQEKPLRKDPTRSS